ncbi:MAG: HPP family protein [Nostocaceae cyanobacterium]|nr:HPP family protein [Nostocaceae cyanobacterium]
MSQERSRLQSLESPRRRLSLKNEFILATAPTITVLGVLALMEVLSRQRLLFASLAASAFLIYLDPHHRTNTVRSLFCSQIMGACIGFMTFGLFGSGYVSGAIAMVLTIALMILFDVMHPPAIATSLSFALKAGNENNLVLFGLAVGITVVLVSLERLILWLLARHTNS